MANYVLTRPSFVGYVSQSSGYALATSASALVTPVASLGSCREISLEIDGELLTATSTNYNDAVVAVSKAGVTGTLTVQLEEITSSAQKLLWDYVQTSATLGTVDMSGGVPTAYAITSHPWYIDGSAHTLVLSKCVASPQSARRSGREQEILEVQFTVMVDVDASAGKKFARFLQA
jgi:hypothetical protein